MPTQRIRQFGRERRRIALIVVLAFAALTLADIGVAASPLQAAGLALGFGLCAGILGVLAPRIRSYGETAALAALAFAGLVHGFPESALNPAAPGRNALAILACLLGLVVVARGIRCALRALPLPGLRNRRYKARAGSRVDIHRLWYGLVPTPAQVPRRGDPDLAAVEDMGLRLGRVRLLDRAAPRPARETHLEILEIEAPFHIRLRACDDDGRGVIGAEGISELFLVDLGDRRLVLFAHTFPDMPLGRAILAWLDDTPGRMLDRRLAKIECRARAEDTRLPAPRAGTDGVTPMSDPLFDWDEDAGCDAPAPATDERRAS